MADNNPYSILDRFHELAKHNERLRAENERLKEALRSGLPALRMAYKGGHQLSETESDYAIYSRACELTK